MVDLVCFEDLDEFGAELDDPIAELEQDIYHRCIESPGSNLDVPPDASLGLEDVLNGPLDPSLGARVESGLRKDARIDAVQATVTDVDGGTTQIAIEVEVDDEELGVTLEVDSLGVRRVT